MEAKFGRKAFEQAESSLRASLACDLAGTIRKRLGGAAGFHRSCYDIVDELRRGGHDLWSIDEADDFQVWGPNYQQGVARGLQIRFSSDGEVTVEWFDA